MKELILIKTELGVLIYSEPDVSSNGKKVLFSNNKYVHVNYLFTTLLSYKLIEKC